MIPFILAAVGGALIGSAFKKKKDPKFKEGGYISNQYIGKSAEQVWDEWTIQQRLHFLNDHSKDIKEDEFYTGDEKALALYRHGEFKTLPKAIKEILTFHVSEGEYKRGGSVPNNYKGKNIYQVWNSWNKKQREHFINDHEVEIKKLMFLDTDSEIVENVDLMRFALPKYDDAKELPKAFQDILAVHVSEGEYAKGGEVYSTLWYAIKEHKDWDENKQHELHGLTWTKAVKKAKEIANEHKKEVRLSTSKGYNNQGHYIYFDYKDGGDVGYDYKKEMPRVTVKFEDSSYDYNTNVSPTTTEKDAREYFVGKSFDMGQYPKEHFMKCIDIDFFPKGTYKRGGQLSIEREKLAVEREKKSDKKFLDKILRDRVQLESELPEDYKSDLNGSGKKEILSAYDSLIKEYENKKYKYSEGGSIVKEAKQYYSSLLETNVLGIESTWNKGLGKYEGCPVIYYSYFDDDDSLEFKVSSGILVDGELINETNDGEDILFSDELEALEYAKNLAEDENYGADDYAEGGYMAKGGDVDKSGNTAFDYQLKIQPDYQYKNIANRWLEDNTKDSLKYKLAVLLLREQKDPDEVLGIEDLTRYARLLRMLDSITESNHEGAWRSENYTISEAEKWARESLEKIFYLEADTTKMSKGGGTKNEHQEWFVVVSEKVYPNNSTYWSVMSKPVSSKKEAEQLKDNTTAIKGQTLKVVSLHDVREHKNVVGLEYLSMGGLLDKAKSGLSKLEKVGKKVAHKVAVKSKELTHDAAVALAKGSTKVAKKLESKPTHKKKYADGGTAKKPATAQTNKMKEVIAHAKATRKEGEAWKMAVKRAWEEVG